MAKKSCADSSEVDINIIKCEPNIVNEITNEIEVVCECNESNVKVCGNFIYYDELSFLNICEINYTEQIGKSEKYRIYFNNNIGLEILKPVYEDIISKITIN